MAVAELDLLAMTGILGTSCIIAVPLMNWSSTIQRLGLEEFEIDGSEGDHFKQKFKKKQEYGSTRIVLVFWNIIVVIGFLAAFAGILAYLEGADWIDFTTVLNVDTVSCVPLGGNIDATAGQLPEWDSFWLTSEFVDQNNCINPCSSSSSVGTLFRSPSELELFSMEAIDHFFEQKHLSRRSRRNIHFVDIYYDYLLFLLPFIILQGVMHMLLFWRSTPQKARWRIYRGILEMRKIPLDTRPLTAYTRFAFWMALIFYIFAMVVLFIAPAAFILSIVATELALYWTPQSETNAHVDQWGVFAIVILVLLAALIGRIAPGARRSLKAVQLETKYSYYTDQIHRLTDTNYKPTYPEPQLRRLTWIDRMIILWGSMFKISSASNGSFLESARYHIIDFLLLLRYEWHLICQFWRCPHIKPERREMETSHKWKHTAPHSTKDDERLNEIRRIKQRKLEVRELKKQYKELKMKPSQEKLPQAPFPSSASSFHQAYRDVEALVKVDGDDSNAAPEQGFNAHSDSTPLLPSNASRQRRNSDTSNLSTGELRPRSTILNDPQELQEPSRIHVAREPVRVVRQHSWRSTSDSILAPAVASTYRHHETHGISPASSTMSLYSNQALNASHAQVSEVNSLRQQQTSASSIRVDQTHDNIPTTPVLSTTIPRKDVPRTNLTYTDARIANSRQSDSLLNDTPHANNPSTNVLNVRLLQPDIPPTNSQYQSSEQLPDSKETPEAHEDHELNSIERPSRRHSASMSLRSEYRPYSHDERSNSPTSSIDQRVSIVHELPPIDIDSSFNFEFK